MVPTDALIRSPVDSKCRSYGLQGCPELVEGTVAYVSGDKALAESKLKEAAARNTPDQLQKFAGVLRDIASTTDAAKPLADVAVILTQPKAGAVAVVTTAAPPLGAPAPTSATAQGPAAAQPASARDSAGASSIADRRGIAERLALYALTAREDPSRRFAETIEVSDAPGVPCQIAGSPATCLRRKRGAITVTDVIASEECAQRVFLAAADSDTPAFGLLWTVPARVQGVHGAAFTVQGGQWLFVAVKPRAKLQSSDQGCFVTWSGFQPRLVPPMTEGSDDHLLAVP
jgi:hypothetical protein